MYLKKVAEMFNKNFKRYESDASAEVKAGAPVLNDLIIGLPKFLNSKRKRNQAKANFY